MELSPGEWLALALGYASTVFGGVWWVGKQAARITQNTRDIEMLGKALKDMEARQLEERKETREAMNRAIDKVDAALNRMSDQIAGIHRDLLEQGRSL